MSGPKRPHDRVAVTDMKKDFQDCLNNKVGGVRYKSYHTHFINLIQVGFKGFAIPADKQSTRVPFTYKGKQYELSHGKIFCIVAILISSLGSVVISAVTSCTNTSNPSVMLGAGLLAKRAIEKGLSVAPYIKTSMSPGSGVVTYYLKESGVIPYLEELGYAT